MSNCRVLYMLAIVAVLLRLSVTSAGPARSLGSVIASRTVKIPRAIRAPFRNNEMMTARGFGKRSQQMIKFKDDNFLKPDSEVPWPIDDIQDDTNPSDNTESTQKILSTQFDESYPVELIVQEMVGNAGFLRSVLERCVDTNHDGQVSLRELINGAMSPNDLK